MFRSNIIVSTWLLKNSGSKQYTIDQVVFEAKNGSQGSVSGRPQLDCTLTDPSGALLELTFLRSDLADLEMRLFRTFAS